MKHVLIIEKDGEVSSEIERGLSALGYGSFERTWTEERAVAAAARRTPDLIVVGVLERGCPFSAVRRICRGHDIPALFAKPSDQPSPALPADAILSGPFPLRAISWAVHEAERNLAAVHVARGLGSHESLAGPTG